MLHGATDRLAAAAVGAAVGAVLLLPATITDPPVHAWPSALASGAVGYVGAVAVVRAVLRLGAVRLDRERLRASARAGAGIGVGSVAAYLLVLLAYQRAPASPVAALRELSILLGILIAGDRPGK